MSAFPQMPPQMPGAVPAPAAVPQTAPVAPRVMPGLFKNIGSAKAAVDSVYHGTGHYYMRLDKVKCDTDRKMIPRVIIEMTVLKVLPSNEPANHFAGQVVTWYLSKSSDYFDSDYKGFIVGAMGCKPEEVTEFVAEWLCNDNPNGVYSSTGQPIGVVQPLKNAIIETTGREVPTKKNTKFTKISVLRQLPAAQAMKELEPQVITAHFPGGYLDRMAAAEAQARAAG